MNARALARDALDYGLTRLGFGQSEANLSKASQQFWRQADHSNDVHPAWESMSHFHGMGGLDEATWNDIGQSSRSIYRRLVAAGGDPLTEVSTTTRGSTIVDWGCGGGANAVTFAPHARRYIGVDPSGMNAVACGSEVKSVTANVEYDGQLLDIAHPEKVEIEPSAVDLFLCLYVLELVPTPRYGVNLMKLAFDWLRPGGAAFVNFKYDTGSWRTRPRRRSYRATTAATMTTYPIHQFWTALADIGYEVELAHLVPQSSVDERYAFVLARKPL